MNTVRKLTMAQVDWAIDCGLHRDVIAKELKISKSLAEKILAGRSVYTTRRRPPREKKFTDAQILDILADTRSQHLISLDYNCAVSLISAIKSGDLYAHVSRPAQPKKRCGHGRTLTPEQVREIRTSDKQLKYWALTHGVSITTIFQAKNRFSYEDVV